MRPIDADAFRNDIVTRMNIEMEKMLPDTLLLKFGDFMISLIDSRPTVTVEEVWMNERPNET